MTAVGYVHGYSRRESDRLADQAYTLAPLLHEGTRYPSGSSVLEVGCGVGSQTVLLAGRSTGARITSVDICAESLAAARSRVREVGLANVVFGRADVHALPFPDRSFEHVFVCYLLEHVPDPLRALASLRRVLRPGGSITVIEGDHGSAFFHPDSGYARRVIGALVELQARAGGDSLIGRSLQPLLTRAGFAGVRTHPRMVYADARHPHLVDGFTRRTFTAMVEGVRSDAIGQGLVSADDFDRGVRDLYRTADEDGVFCYTFFKSVATA